ncbi:aldo/keto reductase [Rhizobium sp. ICMP 5592]|uniref:aldo/keto reductase n=1 Tax=Rhizobium sp. ICMP 5592 TaxID=2292445 RepID=UPI00336AE984
MRHNVSPAVIAIAWTIRSGNVISIPGSGPASHIRENASATSVKLTDADLKELDGAFPV